MFNENLEWKLPTSRHQARESALQVLYAHVLTNTPVSVLLKELLTAENEVYPAVRFFQKLVKRVHENEAVCDEYIRRHSENWRIGRIAIVDLILLRMGVCEFLFFPEIPPKVTIDEAVELAKRYSTEKSGAYINGILDAILDELKANNKIIKNKRGMKES
ncbi:MAG: transcription antitermination factor NusB [candidate division KSB1 bacterium]|nr:transcription antitermination factor NusB [candidate division KSB1 bacterium]